MGSGLWLFWVFVVVHRLSLVEEHRLLSILAHTPQVGSLFCWPCEDSRALERSLMPWGTVFFCFVLWSLAPLYILLLSISNAFPATTSSSPSSKPSTDPSARAGFSSLPLYLALIHGPVTGEWDFQVLLHFIPYCRASQVALVVKNPPANAGDVGDECSIPAWGRSPGEGNGNPLQYSYLKNPMDGGAWWATVHGAAKRQTWLSTHTHISHVKGAMVSPDRERDMDLTGRDMDLTGPWRYLFGLELVQEGSAVLAQC